MNPVTDECPYKIVYKPRRCVKKMLHLLKKYLLDILKDLKCWFVERVTGEVVMTQDNLINEIVRVYDPINLINFFMDDLKKLQKFEI
ncbi:hypothetical protein Hanom_Chr12g01104741 [Helianthus anomalus]